MAWLWRDGRDDAGAGQPGAERIRPRQDRLRARRVQRAIDILHPLLYPECRSTARATSSRPIACWASRTCSRTSPTRPSASSASCWSCGPTTASIRCSIPQRVVDFFNGVRQGRGERDRGASRPRARSATRPGARRQQRARRTLRLRRRRLVIATNEHSYRGELHPVRRGPVPERPARQGLALLRRRGGAGRGLARRVRDQLRALRRQPPATCLDPATSGDTTGMVRNCMNIDHSEEDLSRNAAARSSWSRAGSSSCRRSGASSTPSATSSRRCRPPEPTHNGAATSPRTAGAAARRFGSARFRSRAVGAGRRMTFETRGIPRKVQTSSGVRPMATLKMQLPGKGAKVYHIYKKITSLGPRRGGGHRRCPIRCWPTATRTSTSTAATSTSRRPRRTPSCSSTAASAASTS